MKRSRNFFLGLTGMHGDQRDDTHMHSWAPGPARVLRGWLRQLPALHFLFLLQHSLSAQRPGMRPATAGCFETDSTPATSTDHSSPWRCHRCHTHSHFCCFSIPVCAGCFERGQPPHEQTTQPAIAVIAHTHLACRPPQLYSSCRQPGRLQGAGCNRGRSFRCRCLCRCPQPASLQCQSSLVAK